MTLAHSLRPWALHGSMAIFVASLAGLSATGAEGSSAFVTQVCTGGGQLCNNLATHQVNINTGGIGQGRFQPGPLTCSNFRVHFLVDGTEVAVTGFVGPGGDTGFVSLGFIGPGTHTLGVRAEGQVSGCNTGNLVSWAGTVTLQKAP
jgi:hypothetical protein